MSCREFEDLLNPYFDGELPVPEALRTERHLSECSACRSHYEGLEWLSAEIAAARLDYAPPPSLSKRIQKASRSAAEVKRPWWWGAGMIAAAALVALLVVPRLWVQSDPGGREVLDSHLRSLLA